MKKQLMWVNMISLLVFLVIVGSTTTFASSHKSLESSVLQKEDLPQDSQYYAEPLKQDHSYGVLTPINMPLQNTGFQKGYAVNAIYPITLKNNALETTTSSAFVLNIAYQYHNGTQAITVFEQQSQWFLKQNITVSGNAEHIDCDESLKTTFDIKGDAYQLTYMQEGLPLVNYWFIGVKENIFTVWPLDRFDNTHRARKLINVIMALFSVCR